MATVINNPGTSTESTGSGMGVVLGVLIAIIAIAVILVYAIPAMRGSANRGASSSNPTINVPDKVDVNVNKTQ